MKTIEKTKTLYGTRIRVATINDQPSKTDQSMKEQCDVNNIVRKFKRTGQVSHLSQKQGQYADVSEISDLLSATTKVAQAQDAFMTLPAALRKKLNNNPAELISWLNDPKNDDEAIKLGIKERKKIGGNSETIDPKPSESAVGTTTVQT
ncbi:MAG: internal scaffolding protein [Arizlama microvirus]|nr:MAG: internal scaffolding protein [Arizlama microvirus]